MRDRAIDLRSAVEMALLAPYQRVTRCQTGHGHTFWLKRVERFAPHLWLVKGKPEQAFDRDRSSHRFLWNCGVPVPRIVAEGQEFLAVEDAGTSLTRFCADTSVASVEKLKACRAAGQALARLHAMDLAHGRPALRDMCWDGRQIRFIDFEYFVRAKAGRFRKARDLSIAILSALSQGSGGPRYAFDLLSAYLEGSAKEQPRALPVPCPVPSRPLRLR